MLKKRMAGKKVKKKEKKRRSHCVPWRENIAQQHNLMITTRRRSWQPGRGVRCHQVSQKGSEDWKTMTRVRRRSQPEPEESVRQVKQSARQPWSWTSQRKKEEGRNTGLTDSHEISAGWIKRAPLAWTCDRQVSWPRCNLWYSAPVLITCPSNN